MRAIVHHSTIKNSQDMEETQVSCDKRMDQDMVDIYNGILHSHEKGRNHAICTNMDGPRDDHTKWSKSETEGQILCITYTWNLNYDPKECIYKTEIKSPSEKRFVVAKEAGGRWGWEFGVSRYRQL